MSRTHPTPALACLALALWGAPPVTAQGTLPGLPIAPQNRIEFSNWWIQNREDPFPNFATGNVQGDGLFKVLPKTILERHEDHIVSGYQLAISVDNAYTGPFPVDVKVPGVQLYYTAEATFGSTTYDVPDLTRPVGPEFDPLDVTLPSDASWVVELKFLTLYIPFPGLPPPTLTVPAQVGGQTQGIAIMALAEAGQQSSGTVPGVVMQASLQERHFGPGRSSHSGSYDARSGQIAMYGTPGQPSASGELYAMLRFENPTLQIFGSSSGGLTGDPSETHMGPGAYATDIATGFQPPRPWFGFYMQAEQYDPGAGAPTHLVIPLLVALSAPGPTTSFSLTSGVNLRINPLEAMQLTALATGCFPEGCLAGPMTTYRAGTGAGFDADQPGVFASPRISLRRRAGWRGTALWIQGLVLDNNLNLVDTTNAVRWTIQ